MFQSHVLSKDYSDNRSSGKRDFNALSEQVLNSALLAERKGVTATCDDFFRKVESYRLYFNFVRPNFYKGGKTPQQICVSDWGLNVFYNFS